MACRNIHPWQPATVLGGNLWRGAQAHTQHPPARHRPPPSSLQGSPRAARHPAADDCSDPGTEGWAGPNSTKDEEMKQSFASGHSAINKAEHPTVFLCDLAPSPAVPVAAEPGDQQGLPSF